MRDLLRERGIPWGDEGDAEEDWDFTVEDDAITTRIDVLPYRSRMRDAMQAHRTQISPDDPFMSLPEDVAAQVFAADTFTLARSLVDTALPEDDLFAGLRG